MYKVRELSHNKCTTPVPLSTTIKERCEALILVQNNNTTYNKKRTI